VRTTTDQPDTKSYRNPNTTNKQHAILSIQVDMGPSYMSCVYTEKFKRDKVGAFRHQERPFRSDAKQVPGTI